MRLEKDFEELLKLFNKYKVKYCIIGAYAFGFYARPRYTKDLDILVEPDMENAGKIIKALDAFGFKSLNLKKRDFSRPNKIVQLGYEPVRVDIITSIKGCNFEEVWQGKARGIYGNQKPLYK